MIAKLMLSGGLTQQCLTTASSHQCPFGYFSAAIHFLRQIRVPLKLGPLFLLERVAPGAWDAE